jgi:hypothetical protein
LAQLAESLRYKPEARGLDSQWCHWDFSLTQSFWLHYVAAIDSDSKKNEYEEGV